jgi:hypothetical protein
MRPEATRRIAEAELNQLIDCLIHHFQKMFDRKFVARQFCGVLKRFPSFYETEDRERIARYIDQIAGICGIEGHKAVLTRWLYGPILGTLVLLSRRERKP